MVVTQRAPAAPAAYAHTGQGHDRRQRSRRDPRRHAHLWRLEVTVGAVLMVVLTVLLTDWPPAAPSRTMPAGLELVHSGLVIADPLDQPVTNRQLLDSYVFNGSAAPGVGWIDGTARGLDVGVRPHRGWAGWFAVTLHSAGLGTVWHAVVSRPATSNPRDPVEAVLAVQSASTQSNGSIDYVVVSTLSLHGKSTWQVGSAHGFVADASTRFLWQEPLRSDTPAREPVTIRTDGRHFLAVWFGATQVYASHHLHMNDPAPFQAYLEVQARGTSYVSNFTDFWVASAAPLTVRGAPPGSRVRLGTAAGPVAATADGAGVAVLRLPPPVAVGTGTLVVGGRTIARRYPHLHYAGGDVVQITAR